MPHARSPHRDRNRSRPSYSLTICASARGATALSSPSDTWSSGTRTHHPCGRCAATADGGQARRPPSTRAARSGKPELEHMRPSFASPRRAGGLDHRPKVRRPDHPVSAGSSVACSVPNGSADAKCGEPAHERGGYGVSFARGKRRNSRRGDGILPRERSALSIVRAAHLPECCFWRPHPSSRR